MSSLDPDTKYTKARSNGLILAAACRPDDTAHPDTAVQPAVAPVPAQTPAATATPKPTETPKPAATPVPTRHPDDPAPPTPEPSADLPPAEETSLSAVPPHPKGLDGCRSLNLFSASYEDIKYHAWCGDAFMSDVVENCLGTGTATVEKACATNRLADVQSYSIRALFIPCSAISDNDARAGCTEEALERTNTHFVRLRSTWNAILATVEADGEVKAKFREMGDCVQNLGHERPDASVPLSWHQIDPDKVEILVKPDRSDTDAAAHAAEARLRAINQCALDVGLYAAQDTKWLAEIQRLFVADPEKVRPLKDEGIIDILQQPGPAPFLTLRQLAN